MPNNSRKPRKRSGNKNKKMSNKTNNDTNNNQPEPLPPKIEPTITLNPTSPEHNMESASLAVNCETSPPKNSSDENIEVTDSDENRGGSSSRNRREMMSEDEKRAVLDGLSKANPTFLLRQLALLSNRAYPEFVAKIEKDPATKKFTTSLTARYNDTKITIPKIPTRSERHAIKIGSDLILHQLYGELHLLEPETLDIKELNQEALTITKDVEYFTEKEKEQQKIRDKKADRMVNRINLNEKIGVEEKQVKIARFEAWRKPLENQLDYDEIYKKFDHPYFRILCNIIRRCGFRMTYDIYKVLEGKEDELVKKVDRRRGKRESKDGSGNSSGSEKESIESEKVVDEGQVEYRINIVITHGKSKNEILDFKFGPNNLNLKELKSEASYKALQKLISQNDIRTISKIDGRFESRFGYRSYNYGYRNKRNNFKRKGENGKAKDGNQGNGQGQNHNHNQKRSNNKRRSSKNSPRQENSKPENKEIGPAGAGQMMMMPVTLDKNGKYVMMQNAQPMLMQAQNLVAGQNTSRSGPKRKKRSYRNKRNHVGNGDGVATTNLQPIVAN